MCLLYHNFKSKNVCFYSHVDVKEPFDWQQFMHFQFTSPSPGPPKPPRMVGDRRLLVKLIKGSSLASQEGGELLLAHVNYHISVIKLLLHL